MKGQSAEILSQRGRSAEAECTVDIIEQPMRRFFNPHTIGKTEQRMTCQSARHTATNVPRPHDTFCLGLYGGSKKMGSWRARASAADLLNLNTPTRSNGEPGDTLELLLWSQHHK